MNIKSLSDLENYHELEKICDELNECCKALNERCKALEEENKRLNKELLFVENVQTKDYERVQTELQQYQKALDKACKYLARYGNGDTFVKMNNEQWKEWLLKDD